MPDEKAEAVATYTVRGREEALAAPRHASLPRQPDRVRRNQLLSPRRSTVLREPRRAASRRHGPHRQADLGGAARPCYNRPRTLLFSTPLGVCDKIQEVRTSSFRRANFRPVAGLRSRLVGM